MSASKKGWGSYRHGTTHQARLAMYAGWRDETHGTDMANAPERGYRCPDDRNAVPYKGVGSKPRHARTDDEEST